jgi:hypothetical protein
LREGTHQQTNLGYATLAAQVVVLEAWKERKQGQKNKSSGKAPLQNEELSEYECARQQKILENQAVLIELGLMKTPS